MPVPIIPSIIRADAERASMSKSRRVREWVANATAQVKERVRRVLPTRTVDVLEQGIEVAAARRLTGSYVEFGVFTGRTTIRAYHLLKSHGMHKDLRMFAFDSYEGIPPLEPADKARYQDFDAGWYSCSVDEYLRNLARYDVPTEIVTPVKGWFRDTCNRETAERIGLKQVAVVFFDADILSSTLCALNFISDYLEDGAVIMFDDWNSHRSHPNLGERGAVAQWQSEHPEFILTPIHDAAIGRAAFTVNRRLTTDEVAALSASK